MAEDISAPEPNKGLTSLAARLRVIEERYSELRKMLLVVEQNMISNHKKAMSEIKVLHDDVLELRRSLQASDDKILTVIKELRLTPRKEDVDVLKKYLDLWKPVRFVTMETVEKMIADALGKSNADEVVEQEEKIEKPKKPALPSLYDRLEEA